MGRHWPPPRRSARVGGNRWLSPAAYDALSLDEKRALWAARVAGRRQGSLRPFLLLWLAAALVGGAYGAGVLDWGARSAVPIGKDARDGAIDWNGSAKARRPVVDEADAAWAERSDGSVMSGGASAAHRVTFGACQWGGGTNCVVDGDTFRIGGAKVRIAGIDAPETHDYGCPEELALGERAAARLRELLNAGAVSLSSIDRDRDRYGRLLRNASVDGRDVGEALIGEGLARAYGGGRRSWC